MMTIVSTCWRPVARARPASWLVLLATGVLGCARGDAPAPDNAPTSAPEVTVPERWTSEPDTAADLDTPALWRGAGEARVLVTAKGTHDLHVFDAETGRALGVIGARGAGPGQFDRPNAVVVAGDLAFVVERDNRRVQVLRLPEGLSVGTFGEDVLVRPYGAVLSGPADAPTLWVTDDYDVADGTDDLTHRVHRFRLRMDAVGAPEVIDHAAFGDAAGPGALAFVETIGLDTERDRVWVADESRKEYLAFDTTGAFAGDSLASGRIAGDPEGMALVRCADGAGYWIVTDQQPDVSWFRVFRRADLRYVGSFRGVVTANTDGVSFVAVPVPGFGGGVFFAVHDDRAVSAFDWDAVADALHLTQGCGRGVG